MELSADKTGTRLSGAAESAGAQDLGSVTATVLPAAINEKEKIVKPEFAEVQLYERRMLNL